MITKIIDENSKMFQNKKHKYAFQSLKNPDSFIETDPDFLIKLKSWFKNNTISEIPKEKIDVIRPLYKDGKITTILEFIIDNAFLSQRENHLLLSDDIGYGKMLRIKNGITTEKFLFDRFPERKNEILEYYLNNRYVGISLNSEVLYSAYINHHKKGINHLYAYALRNLSLKENFNAFNMFIAVDFLKKIALSSTITNEKYRFDATNLFTMLISSFPNPSFSFSLKTRIEQKFNLMGNYLHLTKIALLDALKINYQT